MALIYDEDECGIDFSIPDDDPIYVDDESGGLKKIDTSGFTADRGAVIRRKYANEGSIITAHWDTGIVLDDDHVQEDVLVMYPSGHIENIRTVKNHMEDTLRQLSIIADGVGGFGRVLDFGSGVKRPYCREFNITSHVDHHQKNGECDCGAKNRTVLDDVIPEYDTMLCINSMQNNSSADQSKMFSKVAEIGRRLVIVQPKELNHDETDVRVEFIKHFPVGLVFNYQYGLIFVHDPQSEKGHLDSVAEITEEMNISKYGVLSTREGNNLRSVVLMASDGRTPLVVCHKDNRAVDFLVAGHIKYGETPEQALKREMKEEMIDQIAEWRFVGVVEPQADEWQVFVYHTNNILRESGSYVRPERSRGYVVRLENSMYARMTIPRVVLMCVNAGLIDYDANLLHVSNLKKQNKNRRRWNQLGKEKLSESYRCHVNSGTPIVCLGSQVKDGDVIKCCGPRIDINPPKKVGLYSGGTKVGEGVQIQDDLYTATLTSNRYETRIWCGRDNEKLTLPVTRQCARYMTDYVDWSEDRIYDFLLLTEGSVKISDLSEMGFKDSVQLVSGEQDQRMRMRPEPVKLRFKHDQKMSGGVKVLKQVVYEEKVKKRGGIFDKDLSDFI
jgi:ADP-ribose pyrophosphatase YjhB (NUDIX family)